MGFVSKARNFGLKGCVYRRNGNGSIFNIDCLDNVRKDKNLIVATPDKDKDAVLKKILYQRLNKFKVTKPN